MADTLHDLLANLLKSFDPDAVEPFFKSAAVGLMVPPPDFEAWTLHLQDDQIALVEGLEQAEIVIQAPLDVFCAGLVPGNEWDIRADAQAPIGSSGISASPSGTASNATRSARGILRT